MKRVMEKYNRKQLIKHAKLFFFFNQNRPKIHVFDNSFVSGGVSVVDVGHYPLYSDKPILA